MILKIVIIALICVFVSSCVKPYNSEISTLVSVCGGVLIFLLCVDELKNIVQFLFEIANLSNINLDFLSAVLKILGVGYITEFASDIAEDFGNKTMSSKVLLGGKIVICGMTLPIIKGLLTLLLSFLS